MPIGVAIAFVLTIYVTLRNQVPPVDVPRLSPPPPALVRPIIAARALAEYAGLLLAPANLHMDRDVENHPWGFNLLVSRPAPGGSWKRWQGLSSSVCCCGGRAAHTNVNRQSSCSLCAGISYLPVCGLFSLNANIAEHWVYVPLAFILLAVALQIALIVRTRTTFFSAMTFAALWIAFLGVRTFYRAQDWRDPRTFFTRTIAAGGDSARMLINLGGIELSDGHLEPAEMFLKRALAKNPEQPFALLNLAAVAMKRNDLPTARGFLKRAQRNPLSLAQAEEMLALVEQKEKGGINLSRLRIASQTDPPSWSTTRRYLAALSLTGQTNKAIAELQTLLKTEWYRAESWQLLSEYLTRLGQDRRSR